MTERELVNTIIEALYLYNEDYEELDSLDARTFEDLCILTDNEGLVIKIGLDKEFQVTVVRSK